MLLYQYRSPNGLIIGDKWIEDRLDEIGKTEREVLDFLGEDYSEIPGTFSSLIETLAIQMQWFKSMYDEMMREGVDNGTSYRK